MGVAKLLLCLSLDQKTFGIKALRWILNWDMQQCHAKRGSNAAAMDCQAAHWLTLTLHDATLELWHLIQYGGCMCCVCVCVCLIYHSLYSIIPQMKLKSKSLVLEEKRWACGQAEAIMGYLWGKIVLLPRGKLHWLSVLLGFAFY